MKTETKEHISNENGDDLEKTISQYRADGWSILNVKWEFSDCPEDGVGARWKATFWRPVPQKLGMWGYAVRVNESGVVKYLAVNPMRQVYASLYPSDCCRHPTKEEAQEMLDFYLKYQKVDSHKIVRRVYENYRYVKDLRRIKAA